MICKVEIRLRKTRFSQKYLLVPNLRHFLWNSPTDDFQSIILLKQICQLKWKHPTMPLYGITCLANKEGITETLEKSFLI